jgi:hypothetical protein
MKRNSNHPTPTASSQFVGVLCALTALLIGFGVGSIIPDELKTGQTYSIAVIVGDGAKVHMSDSPFMYWLNIGWQGLAVILAGVLAIITFREVFQDHRRRVAAKKK